MNAETIRNEHGNNTERTPSAVPAGAEARFACVFVPQPTQAGGALVDLAREFSPRVEVAHDWLVLLDVSGLERLFGGQLPRASPGPEARRPGVPAMRAIGLQLGRAALARGWAPRVAVASTRVTALLLAQAQPGLTVVPPGEEARQLAPLPIAVLAQCQTIGDGRPERAGWTPEANGGAQARRRRGGSSRHYRLAPGPLIPIDDHPPSASGRLRQGSGEAWPQHAERRPASLDGAPKARSGAPDARYLVPNAEVLDTLDRWGLRTLGELAALPPADLSARLGPDGPALQRLARGEDPRPLVPVEVPERFEAFFDLDWPIEGLEPLSFVLARLLEPLCARLERADRGAAGLTTRLVLTTRDAHVRTLPLPAPIRDPRVLRTLALLDLESHPPPAGIDRVTVSIEPTPGRVTQFSLIEYPRPSPEQLSTLLARLGALVGETRAGAPALVDSHRPGAFAMTPFDPEETTNTEKATNTERTRDERGTDTAERRAPSAECRAPSTERRAPSAECRAPSAEYLAPTAHRPPPGVLRRFRVPIVARVTVEGGRPVRLTTGRRSLAGGRVEQAAGPWRTSGAWWEPESDPTAPSWDRDEWDVVAADGVVYRIFQDHARGDRWFVEGIVD